VPAAKDDQGNVYAAAKAGLLGARESAIDP
jgi:hypothetical protein